MIKNSTTHYGGLSRAFHWLTALLILIMLLIGTVMVNRSDALRSTLYQYHYAFGILIFVLTSARMIWLKFNKPPAAADALLPVEKIASKSVHFFLYGLLFAMPLLGWLMISASGQPALLPNGMIIPALVETDPLIYIWAKKIHRAISLLLIGMVLLHILGALRHLWLKKDRIFERMG